MNHESQSPVRRYQFKRVVLEWACLTFVAAFLVSAAGWAYTRSDKTHVFGFYHFASWGSHDLDILVGRGEVAVCHRFDSDFKGHPLQVEPRTPSVSLLGNGGLKVLGLNIRYEQYAQNGAPMVWDGRCSLLLLSTVSLFAACLCRYLLLRKSRCHLSTP